jgi:hypothetical protein
MLSAVLAAPGAAQSSSCDAPPGVAGVDQYCEATPGVPRTPRGRGGRHHGGPAVPPAVAGRVRHVAGGPALLETLPGAASGSADTGAGAGSADTGAADPNGRSARPRANGSGGRSGGARRDAAEPGPGGAFEGVASAGSSLWDGETRGAVVLLALMLVSAVALAARRRGPSD